MEISMEEITHFKLADKKFAWLLESIIAVLLAIMGTGVGMYLSFYKDTVSKSELSLLFPYPKDKPMIEKHITDSEDTLKALSKNINLTNIRLEAINHEHSLKLDRLEQVIFKQRQP